MKTEAEIIAAAPQGVTACSCKSCQSMCKRPCWPSPAEAGRLMDAGLANRLMIDAHVRGEEYVGKRGQVYKDVVWLLCPANTGRGGKMSLWKESFEAIAKVIAAQVLGMKAPKIPIRRGCTFLYRGLCKLHDRNLKPIEGRLAIHGKAWDGGVGGQIQTAVGELWDSEEGRSVVDRWRKLTGCQDASVTIPRDLAATTEDDEE